MPGGRPRAEIDWADFCFANADTDEKLTDFVRKFGPVVAKYVDFAIEDREGSFPEPYMPTRLFARQDMQELRNDRLIYGAALGLVMQMSGPDFDYLSAQRLIGEIAAHIVEWPGQWEREKSQRRTEPMWKLSEESLRRIQQLSGGRPDRFLPPTLDGRIVICELLNSFRSIVFPNPVEMHSSIKYGVRPLLYALLRRQLHVSPRPRRVCQHSV